MKSYKIDHLAVAVASIEEVLPIYQALGLTESHREEVPSQQVLTAFLPVGDSQIELLEPTGESSPVARFLARRGPGLHHVCFAVDDLPAALRDLQARGFRLINPEPVPGAGGKNVAFLHPEGGGGVLIELAERRKP
jgi:methylmalonyl-CoA/ethylmalonyl-CoA epimerase